jgi:hypothetical protein
MYVQKRSLSKGSAVPLGPWGRAFRDRAPAGTIKSDPKAIIAERTDWRFLDELKRELKA